MAEHAIGADTEGGARQGRCAPPPMSPHAVNHLVRRTFAFMLCALAVPAAAQADVSVDHGRLTYAGGAEANHVVGSASGSTGPLTDSAPVTAGARRTPRGGGAL